MSSLDFLQYLEQLRSPVLDSFFIGLSALGQEEAYLVVLVTVYLCVGHRFGFHLFVMFLLSAFSNSLLKDAFGTQRPYDMYQDQLEPLYKGSAGGPSFPSGHAQNATVVWGLIAIRQRSRLWYVAAPALAGGIGLSRLYLQVHWPADVLGGWAIGGALILLYLAALGAWQKSELKLTRLNGAVLIVVFSALMVFAGPGTDDVLHSAGTLLGAGIGFVLLDARGFSAQAPKLTQVLKVIIAVGVLLGLREGLTAALGESPLAQYSCYALMGFTGTCILPVLYSDYHAWRTRGDAPGTADAPPPER